MKINGKRIQPPKPEPIVIPRGEEDIVLFAEAVLDYTEFEELCQHPEPPVRRYPDGRKEIDFDSQGYRDALMDYSNKRTNWMFIKSLNNTPGLEWDKVKLGDPETWTLFSEELQESGFTPNEVNEIVRGIRSANSMDDRKFKEARDRFTRMQAEKDKSNVSLVDGLSTIKSGAPVNDSESSRQA